jgi:hypothetical protein
MDLSSKCVSSQLIFRGFCKLLRDECHELSIRGQSDLETLESSRKQKRIGAREQEPSHIRAARFLLFVFHLVMKPLVSAKQQ